MTTALQTPMWPRETQPVFDRTITVEYASLTRAGEPVTVPVTPYAGATTLDIATGLTYPTKAQRARRNPRVALLFADHVGSGLTDAPVVLVQGIAHVADDDLQANTDRYILESSRKLPAAFKGVPDFVARRMGWYFARLWVHITPSLILWWPHGDLTAAPEQWRNSALALPPAVGVSPGDRRPEPWRQTAQAELAGSRWCDLTTVDPDGFPLVVPVTGAEVTDGGIAVQVPDGARPLVAAGPACLTVHDHDDTFSYQRNATFVGSLRTDGGAVLEVQRANAALSLPHSKVRRTLSLLGWQRRYAPRLAEQARRLGQPVPTVKTDLIVRG